MGPSGQGGTGGPGGPRDTAAFRRMMREESTGNAGGEQEIPQPGAEILISRGRARTGRIRLRERRT